MTKTESLSEEENLKIQINQLKEVVVAIKNEKEGMAAISPEEIGSVILQNLDDNEPIHPRLQEILNCPMDAEQLEVAIKRLENDLVDLSRDNTQEMFDPPKHTNLNEERSIGGKDSISSTDRKSNKPQDKRDENQRPLTAYMNSKSEKDS